tara:strand:- start:24127 stop:25215 length:1089 start_codon:yes stop_codon:yes gene_type:complete
MSSFPRARVLVERLERENDKGVNREGFVRFDKNERTVPFPYADFKAILDKIDSECLSSYPDQNILYQKIAKFNVTEVENLLITNGSDSAIKVIFETFINFGDKVGFLFPTYAMIDVYGKMYGADIKYFQLDNKLVVNVDEIYEFINSGAKMIILANPNQPSGTIIDDGVLDDIIKECKKNEVIIVLDQAYIDFANIKSREHEVESNPYLFLTRTFSKAYGLAGVRLGYIISNKKNIMNMYRVKPYSDINILALKAGEYLLENPKIFQEYVKSVKISKEILMNYFQKKKITFHNSNTNFVHFTFGDEEANEYIYKSLLSNRFLVRRTGDSLPATIKGCIRITVGPEEQTKEFIQVLDEIIDKY